MRIKYLLFFYAVLVISTSRGQDSSIVHKPLIKYYNSFATGVLSGSDDETLTASFTTIHGIAMHKWRFGIGVGVEGYEGWRTVPIFGSLSFDFGKIKNNALYVQANAGYSLGNRLVRIEGVSNEDDEGGLMLNPMIGYRISANKINVSIAAGYKLQRVDYSFDWIWGWPYASSEMSEEFNRFVLQIGVGFN